MANSAVTYSRKGAAYAHANNKVVVADLGTIDTSCTIDLSKAGLFLVDSITGTITVTFANLPVGGEAVLHLKSHATPPTVTWAGVDVWMGSVPTWAASKTTQIKLVNDGTQIVGSFLEEYHA